MSNASLKFGDLVLSEPIWRGATIDERRRLSDLASWDLSAVSKYFSKKHGLPAEKANAIENHYRAYIALVMLFPEKDYGMGGVLDLYWHSHILHSFDYSEMCASVVGFFVHHYPEDGAIKSVSSELDLTEFDLCQNFNGCDTKLLFDTADNCSKSCGKTCGRISQNPWSPRNNLPGIRKAIQ